MLGGEFSGVRVPVATTFAIGQYVISRPDKTDILWSFEYARPGIVADQHQGSFITAGELTVKSHMWGTGLSLPVTRYFVNAAGIANAFFRNVITFVE